jgi:hypothetical protein
MLRSIDEQHAFGAIRKYGRQIKCHGRRAYAGSRACYDDKRQGAGSGNCRGSAALHKRSQFLCLIGHCFVS